MSTAPVRVLLDVDTGIDDALALLYAVNEPSLDLAGASAVSGNVPVHVAALNTAAVLAAAGASSVPVAAGAAVGSGGQGPRTGPTNHGVDGLGGVHVAPSPTDPVDPLTLLDAHASDPVTVVACAPLTSVAQYAARARAGHIKRVVMVGGELSATGEPEFNVAHDPEAATALMASGVPLTVYPLDVFETVVVAAEDVARLSRSRRPSARLAGELLAVRRRHLLGDAAAVVLLAHPELFDVESQHMAVVDNRLLPVDVGSPGREVRVVTGCDGDAVVQAFLAALIR